MVAQLLLLFSALSPRGRKAESISTPACPLLPPCGTLSGSGTRWKPGSPLLAPTRASSSSCRTQQGQVRAEPCCCAPCSHRRGLLLGASCGTRLQPSSRSTHGAVTSRTAQSGNLQPAPDTTTSAQPPPEPPHALLSSWRRQQENILPTRAEGQSAAPWPSQPKSSHCGRGTRAQPWACHTQPERCQSPLHTEGADTLLLQPSAHALLPLTAFLSRGAEADEADSSPGQLSPSSPALGRDEAVPDVEDANVGVTLQVPLPLLVVVLDNICRAEGQE